MKTLSRLFTRLRNVATRRRGDARLREEMESHIAAQEEDNIRSGMAPAEARRQARLKFGGVEAIREQYHAEEGLPFLENLLQDSRYALRQFRKSPGYAAAAVLTLALGIGANTAVFLLTYTILLHSLPVPHPGQLIRYTFRKGDNETGLSYLQYRALEEQRQRVASGLFAWHNDQATIRRKGQAEKIPIALATGSVFPVLELHPSLGRGFSPQAGEPGAAYEPEALLSYDYWRTAFGGDPAILGQSLNIEDHSVTIVGVLPRGFEGVLSGNSVDVLLPLSFDRILQPKGAMIDMHGAFWLIVMGRLRPGETLREAQANLAAVRDQVNAAADPSHRFLTGNGFFSSYTLGVESGRAGRSLLRSEYSKPLIALEALCGLMMLLCGVNVALLVLSRISGRLREFAMRSALGAARGRLLAQVLTETILLGAGGLIVGGFIGWNLAKLLVGMISDPGFPPALHLYAGAAVFVFAASVTVGAAVFAGLWPAWRASHTAPAVHLKQIGSERATTHLGRWIIPTQVALGVVLLNAALLLAGTLIVYLREHSGFHADNVVMANLDMDDAGVPADQRSAKSLDFLHRLQAMPGIRSVALMSMAPIDNGFSVANYYIRDSAGHLRVNQQIWPESVTTDYFPTMGTRILEGRAFNAADASGEHTCILSAAAAAFFFPSESPIGHYLNSGDGTEKAADRESCRIVGVAENARFASLLQPAPLMAYVPLENARASSDVFTYTAVAIKATNPILAMDAIRQSWTRVFPNTAVPRTWRFGDAVDYNLSRQRLLSGVAGGFALLALALVATSLYGILARAVVERRREIGIRMALGAQRRQIVSSLARDAAFRVVIGLAAGAILAAVAGNLLRSLLYGIQPGNPWIAIVTLTVLSAVLALAFVIPAGRAASIDPMDAIRQE